MHSVRKHPGLFVAILCSFYLLVCNQKDVFAQSSSGTEFWTGFMDHASGVVGVNGAEMNLYITGDVNTTGTVSIADGSFTANFTVTPKAITKLSIPTSAFLGDNNGISGKGIHIVSNDPITAYAHIFAKDVSGATLLLPVQSLANSYFSLNYRQMSNSNAAYSAFMVIATDDNTTVAITPTANLINGAPAKQTFNVTLNKGQIYQGLSQTDLTGTKINSVATSGNGCKRIAVFSGSSKILIGTPNITSDNLFQQVYPSASWGMKYITVPMKNRNYDIYRVMLSEPNTNIIVNGTLIPATQIINNFYYEFISQSTNYITADKPIQVVQYSPSQGNNIDGVSYTPQIVGDPEMIFLTPLEQNLNSATVYSATEYEITSSYINVVIPSSGINSFKIDGQTMSGNFKPVINNNAYAYAQLDVSSGSSHTIASDQGFNAIAYGFGPKESYGYAAGVNLNNLRESVQFYDINTKNVLAESCDATSVGLQILLSFQTNSIVWDFNDGKPPVTKSNVSFTRTFTQNGIVYYVYDFGSSLSLSAGVHHVTTTVFNPISTDCGSYDKIDGNIKIDKSLNIQFAAPEFTCVSDTILFDNKTDTIQLNVKTWQWDFGNGKLSNATKPKFKYDASGVYNVTLTGITSNGCSSSSTKKITIRKLPNADFNVQAPVCTSPLKVQFKDNSLSTDEVITAWKWDFGDGEISNLQDPVHSYKIDGIKHVTLIVTNKEGCVNSVEKNIMVYPGPNVDFTLPDVCEYDDFAHFSIDANGFVGAVYKWNFGDSLSTSDLNVAMGTDVKHHYSAKGKYKVTLSAITDKGCVTDTIKVLTVNGGNPKALFAVLNENELCYNKDVIFVNKANVPGFGNGNVTSFKIDFGDNTEIMNIRIDSGMTFQHKFPINDGFISKKYHVTMTAYSGESCFNVYASDIELLPSPHESFNLPKSICQNAEPLSLTSLVSVQTPSSNNSEQFKVDGTTSDGWLDPAKVNLGRHLITCYYSSGTSACIDTLQKAIDIEPIATIDLENEVTMLAGGKIKLLPQITGGNDLRYSWQPIEGLSNSHAPDPEASPLVTTKYTITVFSNNDSLSCPVSKTVLIQVLQAPVIPNTFTPNGDGVNDVWEIKNLDSYQGCSVDVFDRWGQKVFHSIGYNEPWDGTYHSAKLPFGTYYYIIDPKEGRSVHSGFVTIIK